MHHTSHMRYSCPAQHEAEHTTATIMVTPHTLLLPTAPSKRLIATSCAAPFMHSHTIGIHTHAAAVPMLSLQGTLNGCNCGHAFAFMPHTTTHSSTYTRSPLLLFKNNNKLRPALLQLRKQLLACIAAINIIRLCPSHCTISSTTCTCSVRQEPTTWHSQSLQLRPHTSSCDGCQAPTESHPFLTASYW